jgi:hypothetical protein
LNRNGAIAEYHKYAAQAGAENLKIAPRDLVTILVHIKPVIDLTLTSADFVDPSSPFLVGDGPADLEKCRVLADILRQREYAGIITPSAALAGEKNLVIYIDGIAGYIHLDVGKHRERLKKE